MKSATKATNRHMALLAFAASDLECANWAYSMKRYPVCAYLSQQAVEKSLKAAKQSQRKNEKKDLWSHNLLDCTNWNPALKKKFRRGLNALSLDQERSRYFTLTDYMQPWHRYNAGNTSRKLQLAREIFAASLAYISYSGIGGLTLVDRARVMLSSEKVERAKDPKIDRLVTEALALTPQGGDFEVNFTSAISDVLLSKCRFYPRKDTPAGAMGFKQQYERAIGPEYLDGGDIAHDFREMYEEMAMPVRFKSPLPEQVIVSRLFLELSRYDVVTAYLLASDNLWPLTVFYANQSIEKSLKSILNLKTRTPCLKGHNLVLLAKQCGLTELAEEIADNALLNKYLEVRYDEGMKIVPDDDSDTNEAFRCVTFAERIHNLAIHIRMANFMDVPKN